MINEINLLFEKEKKIKLKMQNIKSDTDISGRFQSVIFCFSLG